MQQKSSIASQKKSQDKADQVKQRPEAKKAKEKAKKEKKKGDIKDNEIDEINHKMITPLQLKLIRFQPQL